MFQFIIYDIMIFFIHRGRCWHHRMLVGFLIGESGESELVRLK
jgi:hypothetical protein